MKLYEIAQKNISITANPYQGLKHRGRADTVLADRHISITANPYQGLKLVIWVEAGDRIRISITANPYQGLKQILE